MLIDIHAHTSNHVLWNLHVNSATIEDLEASAKKYEVEKIVLLATYFPFKGKGLNNVELLKRVAGHDLFLPFGSLDAMNNLVEGAKELYWLARWKLIAGIKLYPGYQHFNPIDLRAVGEIAQEFNLPIMLHTGGLHHCCPREDREAGRYRCGKVCPLDSLTHLSNPKSLLPLVMLFPDVKFIFSHMGCPYYKEMFEVMKTCQNVYTDISGQFTSGGPYDNAESRWEIREAAQNILSLPGGIDRLLFGTDFPIQSYDHSIEMVKSLGLSASDEAKVFHDNAEQLLGSWRR